MDSSTGITFENKLPYTEEFNTYTYRNFYNGGGVALGDINNDGLLDIYFTGNIVDNKLYLNKGNWKFEDITEKAGVACSNVWSTGATIVDINGDGFLDIYVCKAGKPGGENRHNELFINNGNLTFKESAKEYGLDIIGLSIHSAFFDYDKDGDLDCYLLNNSLRSVGGFDLIKDQRNLPDVEGNKFLRNENGKFIDVANKVGIYSSNIGYGLGITLSDFNLDNWLDIFISNDFFERDYLYLNNQQGGFTESGDKSFSSMSMGSMGADAGDINNDLYPDLFVTEMLPNDLDRKKIKNQYETWDKYKATVDKGYHHQYSRNVLQSNLGNGQFFEIGRQAGVASTEWSWAALIQDFDNDGNKDLFVSNGQVKDLLDRDYLNFSADDIKIRSKIANKEKFLVQMIDSMPSKPMKNFMYKNQSGFKFIDKTDEWGFDKASFSNGSAYGDIDNDGDLDLVISNADMPSFVYRNNTDTSVNRSIQFKLNGEYKNKQAIGAKIIVKHAKGQCVVENFNARGFQSSVSDKITIGLGSVISVDTAIVVWPNDKMTILTNLKSNKVYELSQSDANLDFEISKPRPIIVSEELFNFSHKEDNLNLFSRERMLIEMPGSDGPACAVGDVNSDGVDDVFIGGGKGQVSVLYRSNGNDFEEVSQPFVLKQNSEKVRAKFFDSDGDKDLDLIVGHGGKSFTVFSQELNDALYINDGKGNFVEKVDFVNFPDLFSTGDIEIEDFDKDGKKDIVLVEKVKQDVFGKPCSVYILMNMGGNTYSCNKISDVGMISSVAVLDKNNDGYNDIVLAGKWMPIKILLNSKGKFITKAEIIPNTAGLWNELFCFDVDQDGDKDIIAGNIGLNNFYKIGQEMLVNDFDGNGTIEQFVVQEVKGKKYVIHDNDEMFSQIPSLKKKYLFHKDFVKADIHELFDKSIIKSAKTYKLEELRSVVLINKMNQFKIIPLPNEAQYSCINAIHIEQKQNKTFTLFLGGNHSRVKPQFGKSDASMAWAMDINNLDDVSSSKHIKPLFIEGEIREIEKFNNKLLFAINNNKLRIINRING
jgi:hypothetical protein